jgi:hypothetical protein
VGLIPASLEKSVDMLSTPKPDKITTGMRVQKNSKDVCSIKCLFKNWE